jgi:hypothetical protein
VEKVELHSLLGPSVNASGPGEADALHFDGSTSDDVSGPDRD